MYDLTRIYFDKHSTCNYRINTLTKGYLDVKLLNINYNAGVENLRQPRFGRFRYTRQYDEDRDVLPRRNKEPKTIYTLRQNT